MSIFVPLGGHRNAGNGCNRRMHQAEFGESSNSVRTHSLTLQSITRCVRSSEPQLVTLWGRMTFGYHSSPERIATD